MSSVFASKRILYLGILIGIVFSVPFLGLGGSGSVPTSCPSTTPTSPCLIGVQSLNAQSCTIATTANSCTKVYTFNPAYSIVPYVEVTCDGTNSPFCTASATHIYSSQFIATTIDFQNSLQNSTILYFDSEVATNRTSIPNIDTAIKTSTTVIPPFTDLIDIATGFIQTNTNSVNQDVTLMLEDSVNGILNTMRFHPQSLSINKGRTPFTITATTVPASVFAPTESINVVGAVADANTAVMVTSFQVFGIQNNFQTWMNMPSALTDLYGSLSYRQQFIVSPGLTGTNVVFCAYILLNSNSATAILQAQSSPDGTTWTNFGASININSITPPIQLCSTATVTLTAGTYFFRIVGQNGGGVSDDPAFGRIWAYWQQSVSITVNLNPVLGWINKSATGFTATCSIGANPTATFTCDFQWLAGIKG